MFKLASESTSYCLALIVSLRKELVQPCLIILMRQLVRQLSSGPWQEKPIEGMLISKIF